MADVTTIKAGRWGLSRPLFVDGGWTTYAMDQRLGSAGVENYFPPRASDGTPLVNACLVRLKGTTTAPTDDNTVLFPRNLVDLADVTLGELTAAQRNAIRSTLESWLTGYTFRDWDGVQVIVPAFSERVATYTAETTLKQIARHIFKHLAHSVTRPKPQNFETHNTEFLDDFSTDPSSRWTAAQGSGTWDSGNEEFDCEAGSVDTLIRYSASDPGSPDAEAQATFLNNTSQYSGGGGCVRMDSGGAADGYGIAVLDWAGQNTLELFRWNAGTRSHIASFTGYTVADNDWLTIRVGSEGAVGANVVIPIWMLNHGSTKPSDPGWVGTDATPDDSYTDTDGDRLDGANHSDCGISHRTGGINGDSRHCFFKMRAISDRTGGGTAHALEGSVSGVSTITASLAGSKPLAGPVTAQTMISAALSGTKPLAGSCDEQSGISGALSGAKPLAGSLATVSTITGTMDLDGRIDLAGSLTAVNTLSGSLDGSKPLVATLSAVSTINGGLSYAAAFAGSVGSTFAIGGALSIQSPTGTPRLVLPAEERVFIFPAKSRVFTFPFGG